MISRRSKTWRGVGLLASLCALLVVAVPVNADPPLEDWCCEGDVGDVNMDGLIDITDVAVLIDNQFLTLTPLPCWGEADLDFNYYVDISDLALLIDCQFMSITGCYGVPCPPPPDAASGSLVSRSGCKGPLALAATSNEITPEQSCIVWSYDGSGTMALSHINAGFNCCPTLNVSVDIEDGTITLREVETLGECACLCLFDLEFEINNLPPGVYRVLAEEQYVHVSERMEAIDFFIDLVDTPEGVHCVQRLDYPWGIYETEVTGSR